MFRSGTEGRTRFIVAALSMLAGIYATVARGEWLVESQAIMGTEVNVELWCQDPQQGQAAVDAVMAEMRRTDQWLSPWIDSSELSAVNRGAFAAPVTVSAELIGLLARSFEISTMSDGAFDITFASVGYLYDFRAHQRPTDAQRKAALAAIDYHHVLLDRDANTVRFGRQGVRIDLGGIAKGYAVDRSIDILRRAGVQHAAVSAGGDSGFLGDRIGRPWIVGIRHPRQRGETVLSIPLRDAALSTSGDYQRYFDEDGTRYHHILDPADGDSARSVVSVTVVGPDATTTDALSTTLFVLGVDRGLALINAMPDFDAVFIDPQGKVFYSDGLAAPAQGDF